MFKASRATNPVIQKGDFMQTISIPRFGTPEVLQALDRPSPHPGPNEVTIDVAYAGVNYAEILFRKGVIADLPLPFTPGIEVSGYVRELGTGVGGFEVGQRVAALSIVNGGGYAQTVTVPAALTVPLPQSLPLEVAAAFPSNTTTAYLVWHELAHLRAGEAVVVHAAAGGVGGVLGQMARALKAGRVIGTVGSATKIEYARSLGFDEVVLADGFEASIGQLTNGRGVDVVVDQVGGTARQGSLNLLRPLGRLVVMGNASDAEDVPVSPLTLWFSSKSVLGFNLQLLSATYPELVGQSMRAALGHVQSGQVRVDVTRVLPLSEAAEAHRLIEARATKGKLVLRVGGEQS